MLGYGGVLVADPWLQNQFTQVELRRLRSKFVSAKREMGHVTVNVLPPLMGKLKGLNQVVMEPEIANFLAESYPDTNREIDFELFLQVYLDLKAKVAPKSSSVKGCWSFLKATTTTHLHTINESEKASYVAHINNYLGEDPFLQNKLINAAVPGTIDERAINTKQGLNHWERNENHTLCLNSAKAIGCIVVNIGTQDLIEGRIKLLADLNLKKTPQLMELADDNKDVEELMSLAPEKMLLKWMNFHLKRAGYKKTVTNFSSDVKFQLQDLCWSMAGLVWAWAILITPEYTTNHWGRERRKRKKEEEQERSKERMQEEREEEDDNEEEEGKKRKKKTRCIEQVVSSEGWRMRAIAGTDNNLDGRAYAYLLDALAPELSRTLDIKDRNERAKRVIEQAEMLGCERYLSPKDIVEGSPNLNLAFVAQIFQHKWVLLEALDKVSPGSVNWRQATKPPIKMPFRKVENCNQVIKVGKQLNFSLLMRFNSLQLLKNLRFHTRGKEISDAGILDWANNKVKESGRTSRMESFKDKNLSSGIFFLELLSAVGPRVVNWKLVTRGILSKCTVTSTKTSLLFHEQPKKDEEVNVLYRKSLNQTHSHS
ncbi:hypothetical protein C4D60_Mb03t03670 [Musa balbisiana]|uniref:Calponin-homology (CH) domain-containing protein n=1 Tax=Musa balbisiana TaxID=52838 RepID=A0A4S8J7E2_MUSBA|nr:hypothetical protein C4D60_Mb03t03670 [Musa balbisiana]